MDYSSFRDSKILITGNTGFKGSWLSLWLDYLGAKVYGLSNDIVSIPSHYNYLSSVIFSDDRRINVTDSASVSDYINEIKPDFIFHLAAQALVKDSYDNPSATIATNALGTVSILDSIKDINWNCTVIFITSDKVYENVEWCWGYREIDKIGGSDPYSASKGMAELAIKSYFDSFIFDHQFVKIATTRAGNVIGGGDWANNRIVPDFFRAWSINETLYLRSPYATRPWQHVLEPLSGYLTLALMLDNKLSGEAFNFGPDSNNNFTVSDLIQNIGKHWKNSKVEIDNSIIHKPESGLLKLDCDKAKSLLDWHSKLDFDATISLTANWYSFFIENNIYPNKIQQKSIEQIEEYMNFN